MHVVRVLTSIMQKETMHDRWAFSLLGVCLSNIKDREEKGEELIS